MLVSKRYACGVIAIVWASLWGRVGPGLEKNKCFKAIETPVDVLRSGRKVKRGKSTDVYGGEPLGDLKVYVAEAIEIIQRWEDAYDIKCPSGEASKKLSNLLSNDRICIETINQSDQVAATAFPGRYKELDIRNEAGDIVAVQEGIGSESIHVKRTEIAAGGVNLAPILMHEAYHLLDRRYSREDQASYELAAYTWCLQELSKVTGLPKSGKEPASDTECEVVSSYLRKCAAEQAHWNKEYRRLQGG